MGDGPEFNPHIATVIHGMNITGIDDDSIKLNPSLDQYEMRPGHHAVVVGTKAEVDSEFTVATLLDPKEYVDRFPDYQDRLHNKHVLTKWYCSTEQSGQLGWYPLVRLIPIQTEEQFEFLLERIKEMDSTGARSKIAPPDWLKEAFSTYMEALSQVQPDTIPMPARCKNCGSREVEIHGRKTSVIAAPAGVITTGGRRAEVPRSTGAHRGEHLRDPSALHGL